MQHSVLLQLLISKIVAGINWKLLKLSQCIGDTNKDAISLTLDAMEALLENFAQLQELLNAHLISLPLEVVSQIILGWEDALMFSQYMIVLVH